MAKSRGRKFAEITSPTSGVFDLTSVPTITNAKLQNSAMTLAGSSVSLGGTGVANTDALSEGSSNLYFTDARGQTFLGGGTLAGNIVVPDNRSIYVGSSSDFRIVHNVNNTQLTNATGALQITSNGGVTVTGATTFSADLTVDTNTLKVDSSNNRVGIGTTSPNTNLQLYHATDDISINVNHGTGGSYPKKSGISFGAISTSLGGDATFTGGAGIQVTNTAASNNPTEMGFFTTSGGAPTTRMLINSDGNVGIGDTNPATELVVKSSDDTQVQIVSGASNDAYLSFLNGTIQHGFKQDNTGLFTLNYYGGGSTVERIAVKTDGNVGIGEISPSELLHVKGTNGSIAIDGNGASNTASIKFINDNSSGIVSFDTVK